jgi:hypothetical protein
MVNPYAWSGRAQEMSGAATTVAAREVPADVSSVARMWVAAAYDDLRRASPDRAFEVRRILDGYVTPWFGPQTTTVGDISYFMVHEWLLNLVGRGRGDLEDGPAIPAVLRVAETDTEVSLSQAAEMAEVSLATAQRRWRDGELPGAYRDSQGHIRVPEPTVAALRTARRSRPAGLSDGRCRCAVGAPPGPWLCAGEWDRATRFRPY